MTTIGFYPLDVTYKVVNDATQVYLFGRTTNNKQICVIDSNAKPSFYVVPQTSSAINDVLRELKNLTITKGDYTYKVVGTKLVEGVHGWRTVNAIKVSVNRPKALAGMRDEVKKISGVKDVLESDIPFKRKYWIENQITPMNLVQIDGEFVKDKMKVPCFRADKIEKGDTSLDDPKLLAFDIETYNPLGKTVMPEKFPILMISFYGSGIKKVITWKRFKTELDYIEFVDGEGELIRRFKEIVEEYGPDALVGYYSDGFDFPYIIKRAEIHKVKLDLSLDHGTPKVKTGFRKSVETTGMTHIDVINYVKQIARSIHTASLKLDDVAHALLRENKDVVDIEKLAHVWDNETEGLERYCKYNLRDSELTYRVMEKILPNITELVKLIGQPMHSLERMGYGQLVEWYLMKRSIDFEHFIPNKPSHTEIERRMYTHNKGGKVMEPEAGLYKDVHLFDFRSLYPTIIIAHNISPETINCSCCINTNEVPSAPKKLWFCKKQKGFFSTVLDDVVTRRMRIKEILKTTEEDKKTMLDARQESLKILSNSFYGYLGFFSARWYSKECASAVTAYCRHYLQKVIDSALENGLDVVYADTDSVFIVPKGKTIDEIMKFGDKINYELPQLMELEYEGHYKTALFVSTKESHGAKKRYALLDDADRVFIKGFETVRRNWSFVAREVQEKVIELVLKEEQPSIALNYVKEHVRALRKKEMPVGAVVIETQLTKPISAYENIGPHVAVAKIMEQKGEDVPPGTVIRYVVTEGEGKLRDRAKLPDDVAQKDYDSDYYVDNQLVPAVEKILEVFGYKKEDIAEEKEQSKLDTFFG